MNRTWLQYKVSNQHKFKENTQRRNRLINQNISLTIQTEKWYAIGIGSKIKYISGLYIINIGYK